MTLADNFARLKSSSLPYTFHFARRWLRHGGDSHFLGYLRLFHRAARDSSNQMSYENLIAITPFYVLRMLIL